MAEMNHTVYRGPAGETTEWEDLHRKFGNLPELPPKVDDYYAEDAPEETREEKLERMGEEDVEALEDGGFEDRRFLEEWKERRRQEMQSTLARAKFGTVRDIQRSEFVAEVTEASKAHWVVVFLYLGSHDPSKLLAGAMEACASRHRDVKFVRIVATDCIENFRVSDAPGVFVYHEGAVVKQIFTLRELGGSRVNASVLEWVLAELGAVKTALDEDPRATLARGTTFVDRSRRAARDSDSEGGDSDEDGGAAARGRRW